MSGGIQKRPLALFLLVLAAVVLVLVVRWATAPSEPGIEIVDAAGLSRIVSLTEIRRYAAVERPGAYQNQFGNWGGDAVYTGVRLRDLLPGDYTAVTVFAEDGYRARFTRAQIADNAYPVIVAYCVDGVCMPDLDQGFRIAVLPEDGDVGNAEYGVDSAGSYWVRDVVRFELD